MPSESVELQMLRIAVKLSPTKGIIKRAWQRRLLTGLNGLRGSRRVACQKLMERLITPDAVISETPPAAQTSSAKNIALARATLQAGSWDVDKAIMSRGGFVYVVGCSWQAGDVEKSVHWELKLRSGHRLPLNAPVGRKNPYYLSDWRDERGRSCYLFQIPLHVVHGLRAISSSRNPKRQTARSSAQHYTPAAGQWRLCSKSLYESGEL